MYRQTTEMCRHRSEGFISTCLAGKTRRSSQPVRLVLYGRSTLLDATEISMHSSDRCDKQQVRNKWTQTRVKSEIYSRKHIARDECSQKQEDADMKRFGNTSIQAHIESEIDTVGNGWIQKLVKSKIKAVRNR